MKIGVIGGGTVGRAISRTYLEFVDEVRVCDNKSERSTHNFINTIGCDIVFLCLPTPSGGNGRLDITAIDDTLNMIPSGEHWRNRNYVLKSTVPIGTTRELQRKYHLDNLVHSPEFLTARCAETDSVIPACNIIGMSGDGYSAPELRELYARRFPGIQTLCMSYEESEAVKLFTNGFYAVKVAFFNEIWSLVDKLNYSEQLGRRNMDWDNIVAGMLAQGRIAPYHYLVPGPDGKRGFRGSCLPKDLEELVWCLDKNGLLADVANGAMLRNNSDRKE